MPNQKPPYAQWLEKKYLEWMTEQGAVENQQAFADWLGIHRTQFNHYFNGRRKPTGDNVHKLVAKLGPELYDILGVAQPDKSIREIQAAYNAMPPEQQNEILQIVVDFAERHGYKRVK